MKSSGYAIYNTLVILCILVSHYAQISSGLLSITTVDAQRRILNPDRVTVGNASDLAAEVRCSEKASGNAVTWLYQNGTAVSSGLRAFGTTQGDGVLRIYPATLLSGGSGTRFCCMDIETNDVLRVTLVLQRAITFTRTPLMTPGTTAIDRTNDPQVIYDECRRSIPDLPSAQITVINTTYRPVSWGATSPGIPVSYCRVETERGVVYSSCVTSSVYDAIFGASGVYSSWRNDYREPETITPIGGTVRYRCRTDPNSVGYMVKDERNISSEWAQVEIGNVTAGDSGIYQCLAHFTFHVERFFAYHFSIGYTIIPYIDEPTMKISSPLSPRLTFALDPDNSSVPLHCSVKGNPIPQLRWSIGYRALTNSVQLPTGFNQSAISVLTIDVTELGLGNHNFKCSATLDPLSNDIVPISSSLTASMSIQPLLDDIRIVPEALTYNFSLSSEEDGNRIVMVNCSVRAYPYKPRFEWSHSHFDNYTINVTSYSEFLASEGVVYWSVLHYPLVRMTNGTNHITCRAHGQQVTLEVQAAINVHVLITKETPSIAPSSSSEASMQVTTTITPTTSASHRSGVMQSPSISVVPRDILATPFPITEPVPTTNSAPITEPPPTTDSEPVPSELVPTINSAPITKPPPTTNSELVPSELVPTTNSAPITKPPPTTNSEPIPTTTDSELVPPTTTEAKDEPSVPSTDFPTAPLVLIGIVVAVFVLVLLATMIIISIVAVATYKRRLEKKFSLQLHSNDCKPVGEIQNGAVSVLLNTDLGNVEAAGEVDGDIHSPISVEAFPAHVRNMHENSNRPFSEEFQVLSIKSPNLPNTQGSRSCNLPKNRYANIHCNDGTRVCLDYVSGVDGSDYIHANLINGYLTRNAYVATQGPLSNTTYDFWRMVWELNSPCIIMLTNTREKNKAKCYQYWPELADGTLTLKDITISPVDVVQLAYYTIRSFKVLRGGAQARPVKQFHYTGWPDFGVPDQPHPIIAFIRHLDNVVRRSKGPDIVHCSTGVGRTGTLITIQSMMKMIEHENKVDIFNFILNMRHQRNLMVQTERQYMFIHDTLLEVVRVGHTDIFIQNLPTCHKVLMGSDSNSVVSRMEEEFNCLNWIENVKESQFKAASREENIPKNRSQAIIPYDKYRVKLQPKLGSVDPADYINASHLDGYRQRQQYILAQGPLANTVDDFWRMIWEQNSHNIVVLTEKRKEHYTPYWPNKQKIIQKYGNIYVELIKVTDYGHYATRELSIININTNEKRTVHQYQYTSWPIKHSPFNPTAFIKLIEAVKKSQIISGGPVVAHDSTSVGRSGTFCVMSSVLEQLKVEGIVDLFFTIHSLRQQQPGLVQTVEQYKFCYDTTLQYYNTMESLDI